MRTFWTLIVFIFINQVAIYASGSKEDSVASPEEMRFSSVVAEITPPIEIPALGFTRTTGKQKEGLDHLLSEVKELVSASPGKDYFSENLVVLFPQTQFLLDISTPNVANDFIEVHDSTVFYLPRYIYSPNEQRRLHRIDLRTGDTKILPFSNPIFLAKYRRDVHVWYEHGNLIENLINTDGQYPLRVSPQIEDPSVQVSLFDSFPMQPAVVNEDLIIVNPVYGKDPLDIRIHQTNILDITEPYQNYSVINPIMKIDDPNRFPITGISSDDSTVVWADFHSNVYIFNTQKHSVSILPLREEGKSVEDVPNDHEYENILLPPHSSISVSDTNTLFLLAPTTQGITENQAVSFLTEIDLHEKRFVRLIILVGEGIGKIALNRETNTLVTIGNLIPWSPQDTTDQTVLQTYRLPVR